MPFVPRRPEFAVSHVAPALALLVLAVCWPVRSASGLDLAVYLAPPGAPYVAEEVRVRTPGRQSLAGTVTLPTRGVLREGRRLRYPAVLLLNATTGLTRDGSTPEDASGSPVMYRPMFQLADTLTRRNIAVLRLDDRGVGASTGARDSTTLADRIDDARAAIAYLRRREDIDPDRIAILGVSEGAAVAVVVASTDPLLRACALLAAPANTALPNGTGVLVVPGEARAAAAPAGATAIVRGARGRVAEWATITLGGAELGPKVPVPTARKRRRR